MKSTYLWLGALLALALSGCVRLPLPEFKAPQSYLYGQTMSPDSLPHDIRWWHHFEDPALNELEELALSQNLDLAIAASRVEQARANRKVTLGEYLPTFGLGIEASANRSEATGIVQSYSPTREVSWELPLFGALRSARRLAQAEILQREWAFRGVVLSLTAEVATTYFNLLAYERGYYIAERTYLLRREAAALTDSLLRYGMQSRVAADQAQSLVASAAADRAQYERLVVQSRLSLAILLGEEPSAWGLDSCAPSSGLRLLEDQIPEAVPVGLPSELLERRPDLMESLFSLDQAAAQVGLARAARLPSLNLTVGGGVASDELKGLFTGDPWIWSIAGSLTMPLFGFGKLKAQEQMAREAYYEAIFTYRNSYLQALSEVEQALVAITTYREQVTHARELVACNEAVARKSRALYQSGMSAYLDLIDAERTYYESEQQLVTLISQHYIAYIDLFKSLGGGW